MSAINPASFQTPLGGLQIPGGVMSGSLNALNTDLDQYPNRRQPRQHQNSSPVGAAQTAHSTFDHAWFSSRDGAAINNMAFQQLYGRAFSGHDFEPREIEQYQLDHRQGFPQMFGMGSPFTSPSYNTSNLHHASSYAPRADSNKNSPHSSHVPNREWHQSFQGLSLDN